MSVVSPARSWARWVLCWRSARSASPAAYASGGFAAQAQQALFTAVSTAVTSVLTLVARRFASRLVGDEDLTEEA